MPDQKPITLKKQHVQIVTEQFNTVDENRIDWDRRKTGKKRKPDEDDLLVENELDGVQRIRNQRKKGKRDKRRQLVLDEELGRVVVKRRRKSNRNGVWHDDYE